MDTWQKVRTGFKVYSFPKSIRSKIYLFIKLRNLRLRLMDIEERIESDRCLGFKIGYDTKDLLKLLDNDIKKIQLKVIIPRKYLPSAATMDQIYKEYKNANK